MTAPVRHAHVPDTRAVAGGVAASASRAHFGAEREDGLLELTERLGVQPKLTLGAPDDPLEREADRVADRVVSGPVAQFKSVVATPLVQRMKHGSEARLQRKGEGPSSATATAATAVATGGRPLPLADRAYFEPRFGWDFS
ncbi:MAG: hypothetical protein AAFY59_19815, partial [Pseudomonadota bacterium]